MNKIYINRKEVANAKMEFSTFLGKEVYTVTTKSGETYNKCFPVKNHYADEIAGINVIDYYYLADGTYNLNDL